MGVVPLLPSRPGFRILAAPDETTTVETPNPQPIDDAVRVFPHGPAISPWLSRVMIVPQSRLLFWFAAIVLPFSVLGALVPDAELFAVGLITALLVVALADATFAYSRLDGLSIELPAVLRVSKDRSGSIEVRLKNEQQRGLRLRFGLAMPRELQSADEDQHIVLPAGTELSRFEWLFTPMKRGRYPVRQAHLETLSRFGFWAVRRRTPAACEVRVYPNLLSERRKLAALFLNRGLFGVHAQRQVGKGRDFEKLREYIPGDSFDEIHWKATARRGHPVTKVFQIERTQEVYIVLDASRLSARPVNPAFSGREADSSTPSPPSGISPDTEDEKRNEESTLERFITAALILGQAAEKQGDLFGLITFTDRVGTFLRARNGKEHYSHCRDALYTLEPESIAPDFDEIAGFIRTRLRRRALLIFLTSLDDPMLAESFTRNAALLAGQHLVLTGMIKPPDANPLFTRDDVGSIDDIYRHLGGHLRWHNLRELTKVLQRRGVQFSLLENERLASELVAQYVGVKQRQML